MLIYCCGWILVVVLVSFFGFGFHSMIYDGVDGFVVGVVVVVEGFVVVAVVWLPVTTVLLTFGVV